MATTTYKWVTFGINLLPFRKSDSGVYLGWFKIYATLHTSVGVKGYRKHIPLNRTKEVLSRAEIQEKLLK